MKRANRIAVPNLALYTSHGAGSFVALIIIRRCDPPSLATPTDKHIYGSQAAKAISPVTDVLNLMVAGSTKIDGITLFFSLINYIHL